MSKTQGGRRERMMNRPIRVCGGLILCLGLALLCGRSHADEELPAIRANFYAYSPSHLYPVPPPCDCDCPHCRFNHGICRKKAIWKHDKVLWHWYIRGNGPAIHERPAGLYWW